MKNNIRVVLLMILTGAANLYAEAPNLLTYQGRLKESGQAVTGNKSVGILLCDAETGGNCYTSGTQSVAVSNGLFRSTFTVPVAANFGAGDWYLEISVGGVTLTPRERLTSGAYSLFAATAAYATNIAAATGSDGVYISSNLYINGGGKYYGDGSQLTNLPVSGGAVSKAGDVMTGQLTLSGSTLTVGGGAFSVGGGAFSVESGKIGIGTVAPSGLLEVVGSLNPQLLLTNLSGDVAFGMRYSAGPLRSALGVPYYNDKVVLTNRSAPFPGSPDSAVYLLDSGVTSIQMGTGGYLSFLSGTAAEKARFTPEGNFGIGTTAPLYRLVVSSAAGEAGNMLVISTGTSEVISMTGAGEIYANKYHGDGSALVNLPVSGGAVAKTGDTMAGQLTLGGSTLTVTGNAFSVGGSTLAVKGGRVGIGALNPSGLLEIYAAGSGQTHLVLNNPSSDVGLFIKKAALRGILAMPYYDDRVVLSNKSAPFPGAMDPSLTLWDAGNMDLNVPATGYIRLSGGNVGISSSTPLYRLVVSSGAGEAGSLLVISTGSSNVIRMTGAGEVYANKYYGDGSQLAGVSATDIADGAVTDAKIVAMSSSKLTGALPILDGSALTNVTATALSGTLPVASGGTGAATLSGVLKGNGTGAVSSMTGNAGYAARWSNATTLASGVIYDDGSKVGIGTAIPGAKLEVAGGSVTIHGLLSDAYVLQAGDNGVVVSTGGAIQTTGVGYGTVTGDPRGLGAVDLQTNRQINTHVASGNYSVIGGGYWNTSGGNYSTIPGGYNNTTSAGSSVIGGGEQNSSYGYAAVISGGYQNSIGGAATYSAIGGGYMNSAYGTDAFVGGGGTNRAGGDFSAVAGGQNNQASGNNAAVGGGAFNHANGNYSVVPGGENNSAVGVYSFAGGRGSSTTANGAFTWGDSAGAVVLNNIADQVMFKAGGGFWVSTSPVYSTPGLYVSPNNTVGIGTVTSRSDLTLLVNKGYELNTFLLGSDTTKGLRIRDTGAVIDLESIGAPLIVNANGGDVYFYQGRVGVGTTNSGVVDTKMAIMEPNPTNPYVLKVGTGTAPVMLMVSTGGAVSVGGDLHARVWQRIYRAELTAAQGQISFTGLNSYADKEYKIIARISLNLTGSCANKELVVDINNGSANTYEYMNSVSTSNTVGMGQSLTYNNGGGTGLNYWAIGFLGGNGGDMTFSEATISASDAPAVKQMYHAKGFMINTSGPVRRMDEYAGFNIMNVTPATQINLYAQGLSGTACLGSNSYAELWAFR